MYEFLKLILTGVRLQKLKRTNLLYIILATAETLCAVLLLFVASPNIHTAASIALGSTVVICGVLNTVLTFYREKSFAALVNEQIIAEELNPGEAGKARKILAENYAKLYTEKDGVFTAVLGIIPMLIYLAMSVLGVLVNLQITEYSYLIPVLFILATICAILTAFIPAVKDSKNRAALYESCDGEIAELKRNAGIANALIEKQSYNAKNTATRSQELFLRDPADKAELRRLASVTGFCALALIAVLIAVIAALGLISENFDATFMTVSCSCLIAAALCAWIAVAVWHELRRRAIYRRNAAKLTDSETDKLRLSLQNEFVKLQRNGNVFFSLFCGIPAVTGFILGAISAINDPELSVIENASGTAAIFFIASAIFALIIWTVIYAVYRSKVKPVEMQLGKLQ